VQTFFGIFRNKPRRADDVLLRYAGKPSVPGVVQHLIGAHRCLPVVLKVADKNIVDSQVNLILPKTALDPQMPKASLLASLCKRKVWTRLPVAQNKVTGLSKFFWRENGMKALKQLFSHRDNVFFTVDAALHRLPLFSPLMLSRVSLIQR